MITEHQFLPITAEDWTGPRHRLEELSTADLKMIYNALLLDTISDGEREIGPLTVLEKVLEAIRTADRPGPTLSG